MNAEFKIVTVVQARMTSTRLPGKVMLPLAGKPLLLRQVERIEACSEAGTIVVATSGEQSDDPIVQLCEAEGIKVYRGSMNDVLNRHYLAALRYEADAVVKIPSDCPLIDPAIISRVLRFYKENSGVFDYVSNLHPASYPDGNDVEVMSIRVLETAEKEARRQLEREHTTPFLWENPDRFAIGNAAWESGLDLSMSHRFTIDYPEDYEFIKRVYDELYEASPKFSLNEILDLLSRKPDIYEINRKYAGVNWYRNHLGELKTVTSEQTKFL